MMSSSVSYVATVFSYKYGLQENKNRILTLF